MRPITHGDVVAVARRLLDLPVAGHKAAVAAFLDRAEAADRFRKRHGRAHPFWGNGSLMAVALSGAPPRGEPHLSDPVYLQAIATVIEGILDRRKRATLTRS
ncbi:MAG: hypothetical protein KDE00_09710 [Rhodobacteraceae bacterium]|nr:hypothetical protein [Paracoccaceae bacterium]